MRMRGIGQRFIATHGMSFSRTYGIWGNMLYRCNAESASNYQDYGGRGISVCDRWHSFDAFLEDMGPQPTGMTLERKDVNGNYSPQNCIWATRKEQARNRRNNVSVEFNGKSMCLIAFAEYIKKPYRVVLQRWTRGWSIERIAKTPIRFYPLGGNR